VGNLPIRRTQPQLPKVEEPQYAFRDMQQNQQPMQMPDIVRVRYGAGDKQIVGALLKAASGQESGLTGVSSTYAAKMLQSFGYPTTADAWTGPEWDAAIKGNAGMTNPLQMLLGEY
jgi:hypothetical protein